MRIGANIKLGVGRYSYDIVARPAGIEGTEVTWQVWMGEDGRKRISSLLCRGWGRSCRTTGPSRRLLRRRRPRGCSHGAPLRMKWRVRRSALAEPAASCSRRSTTSLLSVSPGAPSHEAGLKPTVFLGHRREPSTPEMEPLYRAVLGVARDHLTSGRGFADAFR